jgi:Asp-tRNA(Asn)/Glu-tRNA(Gln) amidotransferase A subunit family amidase
VPNFAAGLPAAAALPSRPLAGRRLGVVAQARGASPGVAAALDAALAHLERLGAEVGEVRELRWDRVRVQIRVR